MPQTVSWPGVLGISMGGPARDWAKGALQEDGAAGLGAVVAWKWFGAAALKTHGVGYDVVAISGTSLPDIGL